jgi:hypothetical protein
MRAEDDYGEEEEEQSECYMLDDEDNTVVVDISPTWRRVSKRNSVPYYFNATTMETSWLPPTLA